MRMDDALNPGRYNASSIGRLHDRSATPEHSSVSLFIIVSSFSGSQSSQRLYFHSFDRANGLNGLRNANRQWFNSKRRYPMRRSWSPSIYRLRVGRLFFTLMHPQLSAGERFSPRYTTTKRSTLRASKAVYGPTLN